MPQLGGGEVLEYPMSTWQKLGVCHCLSDQENSGFHANIVCVIIQKKKTLKKLMVVEEEILTGASGLSGVLR